MNYRGYKCSLRDADRLSAYSYSLIELKKQQTPPPNNNNSSDLKALRAAQKQFVAFLKVGQSAFFFAPRFNDFHVMEKRG